MGEAAKAHEVGDREARLQVIGLPKDGEALRELTGVAVGDVHASDADGATVGDQQPRDHRQQRRLARTIGPDDGGQAPARQLQRDIIYRSERRVTG